VLLLALYAALGTLPLTPESGYGLFCKYEASPGLFAVCEGVARCADCVLQNAGQRVGAKRGREGGRGRKRARERVPPGQVRVCGDYRMNAHPERTGTRKRRMACRDEREFPWHAGFITGKTLVLAPCACR
jgi:hypothetical protein